MLTTSVTLLDRLRRPDDQAAWDRFVQLYTPLLYAWAAQGLKLQDQDAADLVQDAFAVLVQKLPAFQYDRQKSFRAWLRTIMLNKWRDHRRRRQPLLNGPAQTIVAEPLAHDDLAVFEEREYRQHLVNRALELMRIDFQPTTWQACWEHVANGRPAPDVAGELGISVAAVYAATARVMRRLRQALQGLLD